MHVALLEIVRVDHAHVGVELRIRGPRDAPRIGQRQTVLLGNLVLERQRWSEEEMLRPPVQLLFLAMQMRAAVLGTETSTPREMVAPLCRGELHVGGGHVLPVHQVVTKLMGVVPTETVAHEEIVVDVVLAVGELHARIPKAVLFDEAPVGLRGGEQRTSARHRLADRVALQEVVRRTVAPDFGDVRLDGEGELPGTDGVPVGECTVEVLAVPGHVAATVLVRQDAVVEPVVGEILHGVETGQDEPEVGIDLVPHIGLDGHPKGDVVVENRPQGVDLLAETVAIGAVIAVEVAVVEVVFVFHLVVEAQGELVAGVVQREAAVGEVVEAVVDRRHPAEALLPAFFGDDVDDAARTLRIVAGIRIRDDVDARHVGGGYRVDGTKVRGHPVEQQQYIAVAADGNVAIGVNGHGGLLAQEVCDGAGHHGRGIRGHYGGMFGGDNCSSAIPRRNVHLIQHLRRGLHWNTPQSNFILICCKIKMFRLKAHINHGQGISLRRFWYLQRELAVLVRERTRHHAVLKRGIH